MIGPKLQIAIIGAAATLALASPALAKTVCYVTAADSHAYVTPANTALEARAKELGVDILHLNQNFDVQTGTDQLNTCIAKKVDGIILWPLDPKAYIPGMARAKAANVPVVLINSPVGDEAKGLYASFTGPDVYEEGKMEADALNTALGGKGTIIMLAGQAGNGTTIGRADGFNKELTKLNSGLQVLDTVNTDFDQQKALVASRDLITRFAGQITGVVAVDDTTARGFIDAWKEANPGKPVPPVVGINGQKDAFASIKAGEMYATIVQSPTEDGKLAINVMNDILSGKAVDERVPLALTVVTKANVDTVQPAF